MTECHGSWDPYLDNLVAHSKDESGTAHVDKACIIGTDGALWTSHGPANAIKLYQRYLGNGICILSKFVFPKYLKTIDEIQKSGRYHH
ncbi:Profilin [Exaiptasia diaphana]|nr:Profilin [Exaiptasia diaphana]